ncbi:uncharacterized protein EV420DRAFT_1664174 [Desarmillaria tabescens]|uniref:Uncharacterized protein n=1 Tax=Armillaria tabescens TaxID=1929756 RepID=A0AA39NRF2_ARMTA|nr:uncharacterized protein EV420DRAFT_1664174 [Desarmillaria tabescens]KAK0470421.1 hypothetical protein EV420DRAFT_1664174 [Desarmillaria tabescens]
MDSNTAGFLDISRTSGDQSSQNAQTANGTLMQELLGGINGSPAAGVGDGIHGFPVNTNNVNTGAYQPFMSSLNHGNATAQMPFSPSTYYSVYGMGNAMPSVMLPHASPNTMGIPTVNPMVATSFPPNMPTSIKPTSPATTSATDSHDWALIFKDPAVSTLLWEMIKEGIQDELGKIKTSGGMATSARKQRDRDMEEEVQTTMLGLLGITKNGRQAFTLPDPLPMDAPCQVDKHGKVSHNPDWTAKVQAPVNIEFRAIATQLIMQNKKLPDEAKPDIENHMCGYFERLKEVYAQQTNDDARSKGSNRTTNTRCCKWKKGKATTLREAIPKLKEKYGSAVDGIEHAVLTDYLSEELTDTESSWWNKHMTLRRLSTEDGGSHVHTRIFNDQDEDIDIQPPNFTYKAWVSKSWFQCDRREIILKDNTEDMPILSFHVPDDDLDGEDIECFADDEADDID